MSETLLPCPFCGGPARVATLIPGPGKRYGCGECGIDACTPEAWNRRAPGPATAKLLAKVAWFLGRFAGVDDLEVPIRREMAAASIAEHEPARPENRPTTCPWKRSDMTPCVRTDGPVAYADDHCCVGCGRRPILTRVPLDESAWQEGVQS